MLNQPSPEAEATFRTCCEAVREDLDAADAATSDDLEAALHVVQQAFHRGPPPTLPAPLAQHEGWQTLLAEIDALQKFVLALGKGDLEQSLAHQGLLAGGLKAIQANLRHLTWQTQQIAKGDFEQHVDFMGEFSEAFNDMVRALKESQARLQRRERELREVNAELQREVTERQQAEASLRGSNANLRREIAERKKIAAQIRESEARYRLLAENMADVVWVLKTDTMTFSYVSPSVEKLRGYTPEEVSQQSIEQVMTPDSLTDIEADLPDRIARFLQGDPDAVTQIDEVEQWRKDGSTVWTEVATTLVLTPAGAIDVVGVSRDITERRRIEQQIKQANEELQHRVTELSTLNRVTQAVATQTHLEETLSAIIRETVQLFGAMTGAIGLLDNKRQGQKLLAVYNRDSDGPAEDLIYTPLADDPIASQVIETGEPLIIADLLTNPRNEINRTFLDHEYDIQFSMTTPLWARGAVIGTFSVARHKSAPAFTEEDTKLAQTTAGQIAQAITNAQYVDKLRQARDEAEAARHAAEDANQAKSTFLANMSHELRTPMNAVLGFAELMSTDANLNETQHENLAIIQRSGDHLLELINDILDLSKIESGRIEIRPTDFDLHVMLQGLGEMFRLRAETLGLMLKFDVGPDIPRRIRADEGKLRQVLINLLGNAIKFTESGGITLQVTSEQASDTNDDAVSPSATSSPSTVRLHFEVKDTGVGIAPEELAQVFESFVQTESGRQAQTGTGLGLPISQKYVHMMGGDLTVESEVGVGSKFEFDILVEGIETETAKRQRQQQRVVGLAEGQPAYKILIAEDRIDSQTLMLSLLSRVGFEVQVAANGKEAIERWQMWRPDLIFMDIRMPELDGLAATRQIKAMPGGDETAIVAVTASAFEEDRAAILAEGSDNFLRKPYGETDLFDVIARHLDVRYVYGPLPYQLVGPAGEDVKTVDFTLTDLPDDWRAALQQATIEGDLMWMSDLTEEIRASHPRLAKQLSQWINNFQYEEIHNLIDRLKHTAEQGSS